MHLCPLTHTQAHTTQHTHTQVEVEGCLTRYTGLQRSNQGMTLPAPPGLADGARCVRLS